MVTMKKTIDGKQYNTDTAKKLLERVGAGDFREALYRSRSGQFFLHGSGGSESRYAKGTKDGMWIPGEKIIPLSEDAALVFAKEHFTPEEYKPAFSAFEEGFETFAMQVPPSLKRRFNNLKDARSETAAELLKDLLDEFE
jgi:hypothetical protein